MAFGGSSSSGRDGVQPPFDSDEVTENDRSAVTPRYSYTPISDNNNHADGNDESEAESVASDNNGDFEDDVVYTVGSYAPFYSAARYNAGLYNPALHSSSVNSSDSKKSSRSSGSGSGKTRQRAHPLLRRLAELGVLMLARSNLADNATAEAGVSAALLTVTRANANSDSSSDAGKSGASDTAMPTVAEIAGLFCAPGCLTAWVGDGVCDDACHVAECAFDSRDCEVTFADALASVMPPPPPSLTDSASTSPGVTSMGAEAAPTETARSGGKSGSSSNSIVAGSSSGSVFTGSGANKAKGLQRFAALSVATGGADRSAVTADLDSGSAFDSNSASNDDVDDDSNDSSVVAESSRRESVKSAIFRALTARTASTDGNSNSNSNSNGNGAGAPFVASPSLSQSERRRRRQALFL